MKISNLSGTISAFDSIIQTIYLIDYKMYWQIFILTKTLFIFTDMKYIKMNLLYKYCS